MPKLNFIKPTTLLLFLLSLTVFSQTQEENTNTLSLDSGTLDNQFEYLMTKSNSFKDERGQMYKVIKVNFLTDLKSHVIDSLQAAHKNIATNTITLKAQTKEISDLKIKLTETQQKLDDAKNQRDTMSFFGMQIEKTSYRIIMWSVIITLLALLILFIYKYKNSHLVTKEAKLALTELENEFEEHRKTAIEREQKVRRQLQDEINKQKIIKSKN